MLENRRVCMREIAKNLNMPYGSTQYILVNFLNIKCVNARHVLKDLNLLQAGLLFSVFEIRFRKRTMYTLE